MPIRTIEPDGGWTKIAAPTGENESGTNADYRAATYDNYYNTNENDLQVCNLTESPDNAIGQNVATVKNCNMAATFLEKEISLFASATSNTSIETLTICQFLNDCYTGKYQVQVDAIRVEPDKARQNELKKSLPAVTIQRQ